MRTLEFILLLVVSILPFVKRPLLRKVQANIVLIILASLLLMHLVIEGGRWQMIPVYFLLVILAWRLKVAKPDTKVRITFLRVLGYMGVLIVVAVGWVLPKALPVFSLPQPRGAYAVGTEDIYLKTDMDEVVTEDPTDKRELMLKVWYPSDADVSALEGEPYVDQTSRAGFATKYGLSPGMLNYLDYVKTYVYRDIPVADGQFPVLIFSHGYGSKATGYYALLTELASQGYIIINMNHTFESLGVQFPDGREVYFDYEFQRRISDGGMEPMEPLIAAFKDGLDYKSRHPIVQKAVTNFYERESVDRWARDMITVMDELEQWNQKGFLKGKIDLNKIGVFGHSNGGGSAGKVPLLDTRVKAAANLDGITWGNLIDTTYQIPFLYISADWPAEHEDVNSHIYINKSTDYFYETKLLQSGHPNFMDIPFMIPVNALAGTGTIDPYEGMEIVTNLTTAFFDKHLKNEPEADPEQVGEAYGLLKMTVHVGDSIK